MSTACPTGAPGPEPIPRPFPPPLTELDRRRIGFLRLVLVLSLVFLHYGGVYESAYSPYRGYQGQDLPFASVLISFILFLGFSAVPAMSAISGFLFFQGATRRRPPDFARKMRARVHSLGVPFLLWGTLFALVGYAAHRAHPYLFGDFFGKDESFAWTWGNAIIGIDQTQVAYQLWFVRDLILTVAISPLIWLLIGRLPRLTLALLALAWILDVDPVIFHRFDVLLFFCFGAACALHGFRPELPPRWIAPVCVLFVVAAMARTLAPWAIGRAEGLGFDVATGLMRILGALAVWNGARLVLASRFAAWVERNTYMAFYVHAAHYPPILFLKLALGALIDPGSELAQIALYFVTVGLTIAGLILLGRLLGHWTPGLFKVISGGRTAGGGGRARAGFLPLGERRRGM
jgi:hypothetical protein